MIKRVNAIKKTSDQELKKKNQGVIQGDGLPTFHVLICIQGKGTLQIEIILSGHQYSI